MFTLSENQTWLSWVVKRLIYEAWVLWSLFESFKVSWVEGGDVLSALSVAYVSALNVIWDREHVDNISTQVADKRK